MPVTRQPLPARLLRPFHLDLSYDNDRDSTPTLSVVGTVRGHTRAYGERDMFPVVIIEVPRRRGHGKPRFYRIVDERAWGCKLGHVIQVRCCRQDGAWWLAPPKLGSWPALVDLTNMPKLLPDARII